MPFGSNFRSPVTLGEDLVLTGHSRGPLGAELVSRHVALEQGTALVAGPATLHPTWTTFPALPVEGFQEGDALASGTETYFLKAPAPGFTTITWSQIVKLQRP